MLGSMSASVWGDRRVWPTALPLLTVNGNDAVWCDLPIIDIKGLIPFTFPISGSVDKDDSVVTVVSSPPASTRELESAPESTYMT